MEIIYRPLKDLHPNPKNPRRATEEAIAKLAESIKTDPLFFEARPILLSDRTGRLVIIGGEQRSKAAAMIGMKEVPTILFTGLDEEGEDRIMTLDNSHAGQWDVLKLREIAKQWGTNTVKNWATDVNWLVGSRELAVSRGPEKKLDEERFSDNIGTVVYEPKETFHKIADLYEYDKSRFDELLSQIENEELREMLKLRAAWFVTFRFDKIADYYAYQATPTEQRIFEALGLILLDKKQMIANGFVKLISDFENEENHE